MMLGHGSQIQSCSSARTEGMRHADGPRAENAEHFELFSFLKGKVAAGIHAFSSARPTNRGLQCVLRVVDSSEDPPIRSVFLDKAG